MKYIIPENEAILINQKFPNWIVFSENLVYDDSMTQYFDFDYDSVFVELFNKTLTQYLSEKTQTTEEIVDGYFVWFDIDVFQKASLYWTYTEPTWKREEEWKYMKALATALFVVMKNNWVITEQQETDIQIMSKDFLLFLQLWQRQVAHSIFMWDLKTSLLTIVSEQDIQPIQQNIEKYLQDFYWIPA